MLTVLMLFEVVEVVDGVDVVDGVEVVDVAGVAAWVAPVASALVVESLLLGLVAPEFGSVSFAR